MSTTSKTEPAASAPVFDEDGGRNPARDTQTVYVAPPRGGGIGRFFSNLFLLTIALGAAFGGGYFVMDQEAQIDREAWRTAQVSAQDRINALEEQINQLQDDRTLENSVALDLTDVFAPIKTAVSRLAEAQVELVARQISAEVVRIVEADVQNMNSDTGVSLASIADAVGAAIEPAVAELPGTETAEPVDQDNPAPAPEPEPNNLIEPTGLDLAPTATERSGSSVETPLDANEEIDTLQPDPVAELPAAEVPHDAVDPNSVVAEPDTGRASNPSTANGQLSHGAPAPPTEALLSRLVKFGRVKQVEIQESVGSALRQALVSWWDNAGARATPSLGSESLTSTGSGRH